MTTRDSLIDCQNDMETMLCALEGIGPDLSDKAVIRAVCRALWCILDYLLRRYNDRQI